MDGVPGPTLCALLLAGTAMCTWSGATGLPAWENGGNWEEHAPGPDEGALFGDTARTDVRITNSTTLRTILFSLDAPAYTLTLSGPPILDLTGAGVRNDSDEVQTFVLQPSGGAAFKGIAPMAVTPGGKPTIRFTSSASASGGTGKVRYTGQGNLTFADSATAGNAEADIANGTIHFGDSAHAGASKLAVGAGGRIEFADSSSADDAEIIVRSGGALAMDRTAGGKSIEIQSGGEADIVTAADGPSEGGPAYANNGATRFHTMAGADIGRYSIASLSGAGALDLGSGSDGAVSLYVGSGRYTGTISGRGGLIKIGTGSLVLTGANSALGGLRVAQGNLYVSPAALGNGPIVIDGKLYISEPGLDRALNQAISGSGRLYLSSGNAITLGGSNSYTGGTEIQLGTFGFTNANAFGTGAITIGRLGAIKAAPAVAAVAGRVTMGGVANGNSLTLANAIILDDSSTVETGISTVIYDTDSAATIDTNASMLTLSGGISGPGDLLVNGGGALTLTADANHTGLTTLARGTTLRLGNGGTGGSLDGDIDVFGALEINLSRDFTYYGFVSGDGTILVGGTGLVTLMGAGDFTGHGTIAPGGRLQLGDGTVGGGEVGGDYTDNGLLIVNLTGTNIFGGVISGNGAVEIKGPGKVVVTNANSWSGGTTIDAGATLQLGDGEQGGSVEGDIVDNGLLIADLAEDAASATQVSGSGAFRLTGGHMLTITGLSSFTGGTTVDAGSTLRIGDGLADGGLAGDILNNGALVMNQHNATVFGGLISGAGTLSVTGVGRITLTGNNSSTGGTSIATGSTLQLGSGGTSGMVTGPIAIGGALVVDRSDNVTYTGAISGAGSFTKQGAGTLIYNGDGHGYTGALSVDQGGFMLGDASSPGASLGGSATVAAGAAFLGHGTLAGSLTNNGSVRPGGSIGTLSVGGDYSQAAGATLTLDIEPGGASKLAVGGSAALGGTLALIYAPGTYTARDYDLITAGGGITGTFANVTGTVPNGTVSQSIRYNSNSVQLALANIIVPPEHPAVLATVPTILAENGDWDTEQDFARPSRRGLWGEARGRWGSVDGNSGASGYATDAWGLAGGFDFDASDAVRLRVAVSWTNTDFRLDDASSGSADSLRATGMLRVESGPFRLALRGGAARHKVKAARIASPTGVASARYDASEVEALARMGWRVGAGNWYFEPSAGIAARSVSPDDYRESGAGAFAVGVESNRYQSLRGYAGLGMGGKLGGIDLAADLGWAHEFADTRGASTAIAPDGTRFGLAGPAIGRNRLTAGIRMEGEVAHGVALFAGGRIEPDVEGATARSASAGVRIVF